MSPERPFSVVVAADEAWGIGLDGDLPWKLPGDMAWFRSVTTEPSGEDAPNTVIMGRKTWDTVPERFRPLPGRFNVVVTGQKDLPMPEGAVAAHSLEEAVLAATPGRIFVIGGGTIYAAAMELDACSTLYITRVHEDFGCDTFMPDPTDRFVEIEARSMEPEDGISYTITTWRRR